MVFSVEPGIYLPGWGGVRIEDLVVLETAARASCATRPKTLSSTQSSIRDTDSLGGNSVISTSDLKRGAMMELDGQIVQILSYEHQKIGRGSAQVRMKVKNIRTGAIFDTTAQAGSKWPRIRLEQRHVQYLYSEDDLHYFMDQESYEQFPLSPRSSATPSTT